MKHANEARSQGSAKNSIPVKTNFRSTAEGQLKAKSEFVCSFGK